MGLLGEGIVRVFAIQLAVLLVLPAAAVLGAGGLGNKTDFDRPIGANCVLLVPLADLKQEAFNQRRQLQNRLLVAMILNAIEVARYLYVTSHKEQHAAAT